MSRKCPTIPMLNRNPEDCPGFCPGRIVKSIDKPIEGINEEGVYIEACPNPQKLGRAALSVGWCNSGPDHVVLYTGPAPSRETLARLAQEALSEW